MAIFFAFLGNTAGIGVVIVMLLKPQQARQDITALVLLCLGSVYAAYWTMPVNSLPSRGLVAASYAIMAMWLIPAAVAVYYQDWLKALVVLAVLLLWLLFVCISKKS
ncbi:MAG TPA: hypothetical protein VHA30_02510 [Patescibacteria group bacterium]|nr:hypothetical protein [Patescibacteria group bacterium]